jgi:uncharacterized protein (PEP-CTERM system associated)
MGLDMPSKSSNGFELPKIALRTGAFCLGAMMMAQANAARWDVVPSLGVSGTYSSNITLAPSGEEESDFVTQINPGIYVKAEGRKATWDLAYRMQNLFYAENSDEDNTYNQLETNLDSELVPRTFLLDASAKVGQTVLTTVGPFSFDNIAITDNRTTFGTWSASPAFIHDFGGSAEFELRGTYSQVKYDENNQSLNLSNSDSQQVFASLVSGPSAGDVGWSFTYSHENVAYEVVPDQTFEQANAAVRYPEGGASYLIARGIYENYSVPGEDPPEGTGWLLGVGWAPSVYTNLEIMGGERFFGDAYSLKFSHRTRRSNWFANCDQQVTTTTSLVTGQLSVPLVDSGGNPVLDQNGFQVVLELPVTTVVPQTFLSKNCGLGVTVSTAKSSVFATLTAERREFSGDVTDEEIEAIRAGWTWRFIDRTQLLLNGRYFRQEFAGTDREDDVWQIDIGITRSLSRRATGFVGYRYLDRGSTEPGAGYLVNYASVGARFEF